MTASADPPAPPRAERLRTLAGAAALAALAFAARTVSLPYVFVGERILTRGWDPYYHFRRILYSARHFPASLDFDPYLNFPDGGRPIWGPLLDLGLAALVRVLAPSAQAADVERITIWVPPALGALTVAAAFLLARRWFGAAAGWVAGLVLCLLPIHVWYSQLSFVDHHVAVDLLSGLLLGSALGLCARWQAPGPVRRDLAPSLVHGVLMATGVLVWPAFVIQVGLLALLSFALLLAATREEAVRASAGLAAAAALAALLVLPFCADMRSERFGSFVPLVLSDFQPWLFGVLAVFHAACASGWSRTALGAGRAARATSAAALGAALLAATALAVPDFLPGLQEAFDWFAKREQFQAGVAESLPLLRFGNLRQPSLRPALEILSALFPAIPLLAVLLVARARDRRERGPALLLAGFCLGFAAATLVQSRFGSTLAVPLAMLAGACCGTLLRGRPEGGTRPAWLAPALAVGLVLLLWPIHGNWQRSLVLLWHWSRGEPFQPRDLTRTMELAAETADWIAENTPATTGFDDATGRPEYGVFAGVNYGHLMLWRARRPMLVGNFGDDVGERNFQLAMELPLLGEDAALRELAERSARYVVAEGGEPPGPREHRSMLALMRSEPPPREAVSGSAGLRHHRLVYESPPESPVRPKAPARFRVFERVAGARIAGRAPAGARVELWLGLESRGRARVYRVFAPAGADGRWEVIVPYATGGGAGAVRSEPQYELRCGGATFPLRVPERAVQGGETLAAPDCATGPGPSELARRRPRLRAREAQTT